MRVRITVDREQAILAGNEQHGQVTVNLPVADLSPAQRATLVATPQSTHDVAALDSVLDIPMEVRKTCPPPKTGAPDPIAWLDWRAEATQAAAALRAQQERDQSQDFFNYLAWARELPVERFIRPDSGLFSTRIVELPSNDAHQWRRFGSEQIKHLEESLSDKLAAARVQLAAEKERIEAARRQSAAEEEQRKQERVAQLGRWVQDHMSSNDKGRWEDGFLPEDEILESMACHLFQSLDRFERFALLDDSELEHLDACMEEGDIDHYTLPGEALTANQYSAFCAIRTAAAFDRGAGESAEVQPFRHIWECDECDAKTERLTARVQITAGMITLNREYSLPAQ